MWMFEGAIIPVIWQNDGTLYFQVENINTCLTFLVNLGVNIDGITAKGKYRRLNIKTNLT